MFYAQIKNKQGVHCQSANLLCIHTYLNKQNNIYSFPSERLEFYLENWN